jgi:SagB-type dehydrogenase family enzyme
VGSLLLSRAETAVRLCWRPGLIAVPADDRAVTVVSDGIRSMRIGSGSPVRAGLLERLGDPAGATLERLLDVAEGTLAEIEARSVLNRLAANGLISVRLLDDHGVAATIAVPVLPDEPLAPAAELVLSDDVLIRRAGGGLLLESAADPGRSDPIEPRFAAALFGGELLPDWREPLRHAGTLVPDSQPDERWEFHDRLFHSRSRLWDGAVRPYGPTLRLAGVLEPLPAEHVPVTATGSPVALPAPPDDPADGGGPGYAEVAEGRRSQRLPSGPLQIRELGLLLHMTMRRRAIRPSPAGEELHRPVPSGGALAAVGVYPLVVDCDGIEPGLYHYDGGSHALRAIPTAGAAACGRLTAGARDAAGLPGDAPVQVLLLLVAQFARLQFKYSGVAYAAALKEVGVIYQALYLTAAALGIGGCALGGGDSVIFEQASGLDRWDEGSVGEFLLTGGAR